MTYEAYMCPRVGNTWMWFHWRSDKYCKGSFITVARPVLLFAVVSNRLAQPPRCKISQHRSWLWGLVLMSLKSTEEFGTQNENINFSMILRFSKFNAVWCPLCVHTVSAKKPRQRRSTPELIWLSVKGWLKLANAQSTFDFVIKRWSLVPSSLDWIVVQ